MTTLTPDRIGGIAPHVTGDDDDERRVCWEGHAYSGIRELGVAESGNFVVSLHTTPAPMPRGGYFTCIPISNTAYRRTHRTKCGYQDKGADVVVFCDWGRPHWITADRAVLDALVANMRANEIPEIPERTED